MKEGRASRTAEIVCMARAVAHGASSVARFSDPTALALLPEDARSTVEVVRSDAPPKDFRARFARLHHLRRSKMMVARTVAIDDAVREVMSRQVVILGAGLDGRAWRMPELRDAVVFEVDHPDSQRDKRARVGGLTQAAREVRFVPVDFQKDALGDALRDAGHDAARPTTWIWEGVVMYLTPREVESTLATVAQRSAPQSRLIVAYHAPALVSKIVGVVLRTIGEPFRSAFTAGAMRDLLARHGFAVVRDSDLHAIGLTLSGDIAHATKVLRHMRIVVADRRGRDAVASRS
jgi:methyltransferase (TIGR00027 family)